MVHEAMDVAAAGPVVVGRVAGGAGAKGDCQAPVYWRSSVRPAVANTELAR